VFSIGSSLYRHQTWLSRVGVDQRKDDAVIGHRMHQSGHILRNARSPALRIEVSQTAEQQRATLRRR
jgi:hypothetical protein